MGALLLGLVRAREGARLRRLGWWPSTPSWLPAAQCPAASCSTGSRPSMAVVGAKGLLCRAEPEKEGGREIEKGKGEEGEGGKGDGESQGERGRKKERERETERERKKEGERKGEGLGS